MIKLSIRDSFLKILYHDSYMCSIVMEPTYPSTVFIRCFKRKSVVYDVLDKLISLIPDTQLLSRPKLTMLLNNLV